MKNVRKSGSPEVRKSRIRSTAPVSQTTNAERCLRRATIRDLDAILNLEWRCFGVCDVFPRRVWRYLLGPAAQRGSTMTLVWEEGTTILAMATILMRRTSQVLRLYSLAVDPDARGRGLGRRMMEALPSRVPRRCQVLSLEVRTANAPARALYDSIGMQVVATLADYYPDGADGVRYRIPLDCILRPARDNVASPRRCTTGSAPHISRQRRG